jgi:hypothetical protein
MILWPFSPIRYVYELEDTEPRIDREAIKDPFAAKGNFDPRALPTLIVSLQKQKRFKIIIEGRRQGFSRAGSAAARGAGALTEPLAMAMTHKVSTCTQSETISSIRS